MSPVYIIKKDGRREKYDKTKIQKGVANALEKRPISHDRMETMIDDIEEKIRRQGKEEIESTIIGEFVMEELQKLDQVAYIRFASVYRSFADITLFEKEVQKLTQQTREEEKND
jgi:transcriptional repressor NrdR